MVKKKTMTTKPDKKHHTKCNQSGIIISTIIHFHTTPHSNSITPKSRSQNMYQAHLKLTVPFHYYKQLTGLTVNCLVKCSHQVWLATAFCCLHVTLIQNVGKQDTVTGWIYESYIPLLPLPWQCFEDLTHLEDWTWQLLHN